MTHYTSCRFVEEDYLNSWSPDSLVGSLTHDARDMKRSFEAFLPRQELGKEKNDRIPVKCSFLERGSKSVQ